MKDEVFDTLKGIGIVILVSTVAIFIGLRLLDKNYIYFLRYYQGENLYDIKITEDFETMIDVSVLCKEEKCKGNYESLISTTNSTTKSDARKLVAVFKMRPNQVIETNEEKVSDEEKETINNIIR